MPPIITLSQIVAEHCAEMGLWRITWRVVNESSERLTIHSVRLPHGQFRSEELRFEPAIELPATAQASFDITVHCNEPTGLVTENAFVIFYVGWLNQAWRIYVRIRVAIDEAGLPQAATELITTQQVGFSGIMD